MLRRTRAPLRKILHSLFDRTSRGLMRGEVVDLAEVEVTLMERFPEQRRGALDGDSSDPRGVRVHGSTGTGTAREAEAEPAVLGQRREPRNINAGGALGSALDDHRGARVTQRE